MIYLESGTINKDSKTPHTHNNVYYTYALHKHIYIVYTYTHVYLHIHT